MLNNLKYVLQLCKNHTDNINTSSFQRTAVECVLKPTHSHVVERYPDPVSEVFTEQRDLGVSLAEVVQHDELGVHRHADADGLGGGAVRNREHKVKICVTLLSEGNFQREYCFQRT